MKYLLLMRHAKSSWKDEDLDDHERPLNKRGKEDAPKMGALLRREGLVPDRIVSSSAKRATATAKAVAEACGYKEGIVKETSLYFHGASAYLDALSKLPDGCGRVLFLGHNPDVEDVLKILTGFEEALPTAAIAHMAIPIDTWSAFGTGTPGELIALWRPKEME